MNDDQNMEPFLHLLTNYENKYQTVQTLYSIDLKKNVTLKNDLMDQNYGKQLDANFF